VVLFGLRASYKPADDEHPYGHGKAETLAQNIVGLLILFTGVYLLVSALLAIRQGITEPPGSLALYAALFSILIKESLFRYTWRLGKKVNSRAIIANAWDHRSDVLSSLGVLAGVAGAKLGEYFGFSLLFYLDPLAGMLVSVLIVFMGLRIMRDAGNELMDGTCSRETLMQIEHIALQVSRVREIHQVRARTSGPCLLVDLEIGIEGSLSVEEGHNIAHDVEEELLLQRDDIVNVTVHVGPCRE